MIHHRYMLKAKYITTAIYQEKIIYRLINLSKREKVH